MIYFNGVGVGENIYSLPTGGMFRNITGLNSFLHYSLVMLINFNVMFVRGMKHGEEKNSDYSLRHCTFGITNSCVETHRLKINTFHPTQMN